MAMVRAGLFLAVFGLLGAGCGRNPAALDAGPPGPDAGSVEQPDAAAADAGPIGACTCPVEFDYPAGDATSVELRGNFTDETWTAGYPLARDGDHFAVTLTLPHGRAVHYKLFVDAATWATDPANPITVGDGFGGRNSALVVDCGCGDTYFDWRDAVLYFVMLDRFADGDPGNNHPVDGVAEPANFHGGDLAGLLATIESGYFDDLGVNAIWISSPIDNGDGAWVGDDGNLYTSYHGYWPSDLGAVDARVGDAALLRAVTDAAHRRGIRVVMDYVMNHVHQDSPLFAAHGDWFWPLYDDSGQCVCGDGCEWEGPEGLRCWFRNYLPDFDFQNGDARYYSVSNAVEWIKRAGLDGFRLDAVKHIETSWITDLRARINDEIEIGGQVFWMVGETYTGDKGQIRSYVSPDSMLDGQFDFPLRAELLRTVLMRQGSLQDLAGFLAANDGYYGVGSVMSTFVGNHDLPRAIHIGEDTPLFNEWDSGKGRAWNDRPALPSTRAPFERLRLGFAVIMTLPGVPLVYYGDEIGMAGAGDPDNRRPMQWEGLSADQEWLREQVRRLIAVRAAHPALRRGARATLGATTDALTYRLVDGDDVVTVAINRADWPNDAPGLEAGDYRELVAGADVSAPISIPARSVVILTAR